jgi:Lipocalin-like domain
MRYSKIRNGMLCLATVAGLAAGGSAHGQQPSLQSQLIGSWSFVVTTVYRKDGSRADVFGPNPNGVLMFHPDGHFALINTRPGRAKYATGNRLQGTPEEFKETVLGSIAYFGSYSVDEAKRMFILKIKGSTFPDYEGTEQTRTFTLNGDELRSINPNPSQGGSPLDLVLKRLRTVDPVYASGPQPPRSEACSSGYWRYGELCMNSQTGDVVMARERTQE